MAIIKISAIEGARNFANYVNRTCRENVTFVIHKNGRPFARLEREPKEKICLGRDLAKVLAQLHRFPQIDA